MTMCHGILQVRNFSYVVCLLADNVRHWLHVAEYLTWLPLSYLVLHVVFVVAIACENLFTVRCRMDLNVGAARTFRIFDHIEQILACAAFRVYKAYRRDKVNDTISKTIVKDNIYRFSQRWRMRSIASCGTLCTFP